MILLDHPIEKVVWIDPQSHPGWIEDVESCGPALCESIGWVVGVKDFHGLQCLLLATSRGKDDVGWGDVGVIPLACIVRRDGL